MVEINNKKCIIKTESTQRYACKRCCFFGDVDCPKEFCFEIDRIFPDYNAYIYFEEVANES